MTPQYNSAGYIVKYSLCGTNYNQTINACDSILLYGIIFTLDTNFVQQFSNIQGCDSNINTTIIVKHNTKDTLEIGACKEYTFYGTTYTNSGTYQQTITNTVGCDSLVTLQITLSNLNAIITNVNNVLSASPSNGATFQWINCSTNTIINGATNQTFTPSVHGNYAVIITQNSCVDTSSCIGVPLGVSNTHNTPTIQVSPNPSNGVYILTRGKNFMDATLTIQDIFGNKISSKKIINTNEEHINISKYCKGVYFLIIEDTETRSILKLVLE